MGANKFASMLHRNTNRLTLILIYALLEWILIILLLLNSLFSYLIIKFADYFGLKTPCPWCCHFNKNSHIRDLLCESHAKEISRLGYCSNHRKLSLSKDMCEDCSSSQPNNHHGIKMSRTLALFPWVKEFGMTPRSEDGKVASSSSKCSCCGACLGKEFLSPYVLIKPSSSDLEYTQNGNLITEPGDDDDLIVEANDLDHIRSDYEVVGKEEDEGEVDCSVSQPPNYSSLREIEEEEEAGNGEFFVIEQQYYRDYNGIEEKGEGSLIPEPAEEGNEVLGSNSMMEDFISGEKVRRRRRRLCNEQEESSSIEILPQQHLEFFVGHGGYRLIPVESADSDTEEEEESQSDSTTVDEKKDGDQNHVANLCPEYHRDDAELLSAFETKEEEEEEEAKFAVDHESMEIEEDENSLIFHPKECDLVREVYEHVEPQTSTIHSYYYSDAPAVTEEDSLQMPINEIEAEVSIGTEIPDVEHTDEFQNQEVLPPYANTDNDHSTSFGCKQVEEEFVDVKIMSVEVKANGATPHQTWLGSELNEIEEDRVPPDTPTSIENLHILHKKLLVLEKRESGTEEYSLDGSVMSEFEGGDHGVNAIEHLKTALKAERKALQALYAELEEERSASAVAANQTMAMINRLQEEKAAMQMEALQYQRMMDEQSEYDQEALQLLNELMVKREREKEEVERELEVYRKRVLEYESKDLKMRILRRSSRDGGGSSSPSCNRSESSFACSSNAGDSDGLSVDLNQEAKEEDGSDHENGKHPNTPVDAVLNLEESLAIFEQERLSILEQLKVLEEKLFTFDDDDDDDEEQHFADVKPIEEFYKENGKLDFCGEGEANGLENGFHKEMNGKHHQEGIRLVGGKGKRLLPLFDVISAESEEATTEENGHAEENGFHSDHVFEASAHVKKIELESRTSPAIEEEVDHLYERLQALEADREFLKHCISSMKKGEKGVDLLQEILQHLRDLRNVDHRVKNLSDATLLV